MSEEIKAIREEYEIQKKLERIVITRKLKRPNIKKWQVATLFAILPFLLFFTVFFGVKLSDNIFAELAYSLAGVFIVTEIYLRICFISLVRYYQRKAKETTRRRCKCIPSCSDYSILTLKTVFPIAFAIFKIKKRLFHTCDGSAYKIDFPTKRRNRKFENLL